MGIINEMIRLLAIAVLFFVNQVLVTPSEADPATKNIKGFEGI